ncbi:LysM peptidoglycan-binding domain-containing protein [Roseateles violae]|uniref:LysM domain-containing protein n=1 Tax=Roseateles violae TaxID=3058042 RepID=A0ABT8DUE8_9BURK|nr:LysM domain-containing protein [Pelomonas sp. PFR6]MDN3920012.1 LysM domain-containing protein [Pelomonas sp. PFR6]
MEQAKAELQRALSADPANKLAQSLMRQITVDPVAALGRESFSYTVRPNDTMSSIAGRFLGDIYAFYILARYNNISVPRQLAGGQVIRIPGKAPPPASPAAPAPVAAAPAAPATTSATAPDSGAGERAMRAAEAAERAGKPQQAYTEYRKAASLGQAGAEAKAEELRRQMVQRLSLNARTAFAKQDLDGAIRAWEQVLELDPANDTARSERQRALNLKEKVKKL